MRCGACPDAVGPRLEPSRGHHHLLIFTVALPACLLFRILRLFSDRTVCVCLRRMIWDPHFHDRGHLVTTIYRGETAGEADARHGGRRGQCQHRRTTITLYAPRTSIRILHIAFPSLEAFKILTASYDCPRRVLRLTNIDF